VHNPKFITKQNGNRLIFFLLLVKLKALSLTKIVAVTAIADHPINY
jgi:hypothetical protein